MADSMVLDTSACFALLQNEPGAEDVEAFLVEARESRLALHGSFVTLTELEYIITQEESAADAALALAKVKAWPVKWLHSDANLCSEAAKLKAAHRLSFADSFVAATAMRLGAVLVHKDPEFNAVSSEVKQRVLPPKGAAGAEPTT